MTPKAQAKAPDAIREPTTSVDVGEGSLEYLVAHPRRSKPLLFPGISSGTVPAAWAYSDADELGRRFASVLEGRPQPRGRARIHAIVLAVRTLVAFVRSQGLAATVREWMSVSVPIVEETLSKEQSATVPEEWTPLPCRSCSGTGSPCPRGSPLSRLGSSGGLTWERPPYDALLRRAETQGYLEPCRTGTVMERSYIPLHKWLYAMYIVVTACCSPH